MEELDRFVEVVRALRDPKTGCPWDSVQTNLSIRKYLVEEVGEYLDALEDGDDRAMMEELGDLLLQVVLNAQIAEDEHRFSLKNVAAYESDKMIRRHPHVFGESKAHTESELRAQWEQIKGGEAGISQRKTILDGVPRSMPALARAHKLLAKAQQGGKVALSAEEQLASMQEDLSALAGKTAGEEGVDRRLGRLLFAAVNLCRQHGFNSEELLQEENRRFIQEFKGDTEK